jgi:hypothetical protein
MSVISGSHGAYHHVAINHAENIILRKYRSTSVSYHPSYKKEEF